MTDDRAREALSERLAEHRTSVYVSGGWSAAGGKDSPRRYGWSCSCGVRDAAPHVVFLTEGEADEQRFAHVADIALLPVVVAEKAAAWDEVRTLVGAYDEEPHSEECGMGACVRCVVDEFAALADEREGGEQ